MGDEQLQGDPTDGPEVLLDEDVDLTGDGVADGHVHIEVERIDVDGDGRPDIVVLTETTTVDMDGDGSPDGAEVTEAVMMPLPIMTPACADEGETAKLDDARAQQLHPSMIEYVSKRHPPTSTEAWADPTDARANPTTTKRAPRRSSPTTAPGT